VPAFVPNWQHQDRQRHLPCSARTPTATATRASMSAGCARVARARSDRAATAERLRARVLGVAPPIVARHGGKAAYLFGSISDGSAGHDSDVDLVVTGIAATDYWALRRELEQALERPLDLHTQDDDPSSMRNCTGCWTTFAGSGTPSAAPTPSSWTGNANGWWPNGCTVRRRCCIGKWSPFSTGWKGWIWGSEPDSSPAGVNASRRSEADGWQTENRTARIPAPGPAWPSSGREAVLKRQDFQRYERLPRQRIDVAQRGLADGNVRLHDSARSRCPLAPTKA